MFPDNPLEFCEPDGPPSAISHVIVRKAFIALLPRAKKLEPSKLVHINVNVPAVISTILGFLPKLLPLEDQMRRLPDFQIANLRQLKKLALALSFAHSQYVATRKPDGRGLVEMRADLAVFRDRFINDIQSTVMRGWLKDGFMGELKGTTGYSNTSTDVLTIIAVLRGSWQKLEGRTCITRKEIDEAERLAYAVYDALGKRQHGVPKGALFADQRARFYTMFFNAYDEVRRAMGYLRWRTGDAEDFAPSLFAGRNAGKKTSETAESQTAGQASSTTGGAATTEHEKGA